MRALSSKEVAEIIGVSEGTLRTWRTQSKGPPFVRMGRAIRYMPAHVKEWIDLRTCRDSTLSSL